MHIVFLLVIVAFVFLLLFSPKNKGELGELRVSHILKKLGSSYIVFNNVIIRNGPARTSQIDHVVLSTRGIFVIETKCYKGWIFGTENAEQWTQVIYKFKYSFRNPIKQNWGHIYALKEVLYDYPGINYYPIIVFSGNAVLKNITSTIPVIYESALYDTISRIQTNCISDNDIMKISKILEENKVSNKEIEQEHIQSVQKANRENRLKKENLICPHCNIGLTLRSGKYGKFYGCPNYPKCRFTMKY